MWEEQLRECSGGVRVIRDNYKLCFFFFQAEDGIRDRLVTGVQTCALPIYDGDGWLQEHYITEELMVDLQLPDLVVEIAGPVIEFPNGQWVIAGTLSEGHTFSLGGTISNQGTVTATDIQLVVTDGGGTWQFQWPELAPGNSTEWLTPWELSNQIGRAHV